MRVDCEKWIYTTLKEKNTSITTKRPNNVKLQSKDDLIIEQKIQLEQQLYSDGSSDNEENPNSKTSLNSIRHRIPNDKGLNISFELINNGSYKQIKMFEPDISSNSECVQMSTSKGSSSSSFVNQISFPITKSYELEPDSPVTWQSFQHLLDKCMDIHTLRETISIVEECLKLENYLNSEFQLNEKELYFSRQKDIVEYLNKSLKKKLFSLSRSTELFKQQKRELIGILTTKLSESTLIDVMGNFEHLEREYYKLVESIKSRLKLRIAKLENSLNTWTDFDNICLKLNNIFERNNEFSETTNLQYRGLIIEISNYLNSLKEYHSILSSTCSESKYFEMKNLIIVYEIKFKGIRDQYEASSQEFQFKYFTKSSEYIENHENYYEKNQRTTVISHDNQKTNNTNFNPSTPIEGRISNSNVLRNRNRISTKLNNNYSITPQTGKVQNRPRLTNKIRFNKSPETPKLIKKVETHDKSTFTVNDVSSQTDQEFHQEQFYSTEHMTTTFHKNTTKHTESDGKKLLLEAYLRNNDSHLVHNSQTGSSQSSNSCLIPNTLNKQCKKRKSLTNTDTRESGIGTYIDDEIATSSCDLEFAKVASEKKHDSHTDNESNEYYLTNTSKKATKNKSPKRDIDSEQSKQSQVIGQFAETSSKTGWFSWFFKTVFTFLLFFLTIIFVIFVYFFYSLVLNPSCCDYQRTYLMFNVT